MKSRWIFGLLLALVSCTNPSDETVYQGACYSADCAGDSCADTYVEAGTPCDGGYQHEGTCDAEGNCAECMTDSDCAAKTGCAPFMCDNKICEPTTLCSTCSDVTDCQVSECGVSNCTTGVCSYTSLAAGTVCGSGFCDGKNSCVQCLKDSDCQKPIDCWVGVCIDNGCGITPLPAGSICGTGLACDDNGNCTVQPCNDGMQDFGKTDVDCGGTFCGNAGFTCNQGQSCATGTDCTSMSCVDGGCAAPRCGDGIVTVAVGEQCDPPGPGCSATCQLTTGRYVGDQVVTPGEDIVVTGTSGAVGALEWAGKSDIYLDAAPSGCGGVHFALDDGFGNCPASLAQNAQLSVSDEQSGSIVNSGADGTCGHFDSTACDSYVITIIAPETRVVPFYVLEVRRAAP